MFWRAHGRRKGNIYFNDIWLKHNCTLRITRAFLTQLPVDMGNLFLCFYCSEGHWILQFSTKANLIFENLGSNCMESFSWVMPTAKLFEQIINSCNCLFMCQHRLKCTCSVKCSKAAKDVPMETDTNRNFHIWFSSALSLFAVLVTTSNATDTIWKYYQCTESRDSPLQSPQCPALSTRNWVGLIPHLTYAVSRKSQV